MVDSLAEAGLRDQGAATLGPIRLDLGRGLLLDDPSGLSLTAGHLLGIEHR